MKLPLITPLERIDFDMAKNENTGKKRGQGYLIAKDFRINWKLYLLVLPVILYYIIFCYVPMYGALIAFKEFSPGRGFMESPWIGFTYFEEFFSSVFFNRVLKNTLLISLSSLLVGFPMPIILALLVNEVSSKNFRKTVQTVSYLPHFISLVVICGMIKEFTSVEGIINDIIVFFGGERTPLLANPKMFVPIYVLSGVWQEVGWGSIIYIAAIAGVDQSLYEAAGIDGAGRLRQTWHVTLPSILPTIIILFIMRVGNLLNVGFEKIILLYNPSIYESADVISSYVYRKGILEYNYSYSTAVGLFNSVVNFTLLVVTNFISKKTTENSLW